MPRDRSLGAVVVVSCIFGLVNKSRTRPLSLSSEVRTGARGSSPAVGGAHGSASRSKPSTTFGLTGYGADVMLCPRSLTRTRAIGRYTQSAKVGRAEIRPSTSLKPREVGNARIAGLVIQ